MTSQTRSVNKGRFETGDKPDGSSYADLIDSFLSLADSTAQTVASNTTFPTVIATEVSAVTGNFDTVNASAANFTYASAASLVVNGFTVTGAGGGAYAESYITATAATSIGSAGTFEIINGTFSAVATPISMSASPTSALIEYTGTSARRMFVTANLSVAAAVANKLLAFRVGRNGSSLSRTEIERFVSTTDIGALSVTAIVSVNPSDTIEVHGANKTDANNLTAQKAVITIVEVP